MNVNLADRPGSKEVFVGAKHPEFMMLKGQ